MKVIDKVKEKERKEEYLKKISGIFEKITMFHAISEYYYGFNIKLFDKKFLYFFRKPIARIDVDYNDNEIEAKVGDISSEQLEIIKSALKDAEGIRNKTKVTLTIVEKL